MQITDDQDHVMSWVWAKTLSSFPAQKVAQIDNMFTHSSIRLLLLILTNSQPSQVVSCCIIFSPAFSYQKMSLQTVTETSVIGTQGRGRPTLITRKRRSWFALFPVVLLISPKRAVSPPRQPSRSFLSRFLLKQPCLPPCWHAVSFAWKAQNQRCAAHALIYWSKCMPSPGSLFISWWSRC